MSTDATPSWSGYIFQGEVALCKAIETITALGENIPDNYYLKLEQDEDFSLKTNSIEVFQVKAYLSKDSDKISKYKGVIEELINKYYYSKTVEVDPNDGRKRIKTYSDKVRKKPIKCSLITDKKIVDYPTNLSTFDDRFKLDTNYFDSVQGIYTLDSINSRLKDAIRNYLNNPNLVDQDLEDKVSYCSKKICDIVKKRHSTKEKESIPLNTIKKWIEDSSVSFTEEICWYEITKIFLNSIADGIDDYDLTDGEELEIYNKIQQSLFEFENLSNVDIVNLLKLYLSPHKKLDNNNLRNSYGSFIDDITVRNIILKGIKKIKISPIFKKLQYIKTIEGKVNRYQLLIHNEEFDNDTAGKKKFQKHCEMIYQNPYTKDIDYFVTKGLNKEKDEVKSRLLEIKDIGDDLVDDSNYFGFKTIDISINELNDENNN
ncbi:hypothetical protein ATE47_09870 [Chryseobacterium sp. IHB B 17019]|uniref:ABC-three component system protein n=1 Tax=Chryseobacterium sp. IHB B 17019 TaxID=1721091 RepID=UPI0007230E03|nr:ABC-three component system protein [Chryseobacterium sp. IHB B 17019]ALR30814.1 hypothetical protein ATE47_09870 [Chryseobacterium sp. IHB B 17019]